MEKLKFRTVYRFTGGKKGKPRVIKFSSLRIGDYFYMEDSTGEIVVGQKGCVVFRCLGRTRFIGTQQNETVEAKPIA